jgi:phage terminase small subunit
VRLPTIAIAVTVALHSSTFADRVHALRTEFQRLHPAKDRPPVMTADDRKIVGMNNPNATTRQALPSQIERFVAGYMASANATGAALRAGYAPRSAKQQGSRLLKRPDVIEALRGRRQQLKQVEAQSLKPVELSAERTRRELAKLAYFDLRRMVNDDGSAKPLSELDDDCAAAVAGFEVVDTWSGSGAERQLVSRVWKYRFHSKLAALDMAARVLGLYAKDNQQPGNVREMSDEELYRRVMTLLSAADRRQPR